jgi:archaemetzincin
MSPLRRQTRQKLIKFARGFKIPTKDSIHKALKTTTTKNKNYKHENILLKLVDHFKPLPLPTNDLDWLAQFCEIGQSCQDFIKWSPIRLENDIGIKKFIYYVQIGEFSKNKMKFDDLIDYSKRFFTDKSIKFYPQLINIKINKIGHDIKINVALAGKNLEKKLNFRYNEKTKHFQILTKSLLKFLEEIKPKDAIAMIGLTEHDLYVEDSDLFVAGLCNGKRSVGVFSSFRYDPSIKFCDENWFNITKLKTKANYKLLLNRTCKLMVHETCHLLGFDHCTFMDCCMNGSGHIEEDYSQSMFLCPIDLKKLALILNFDIIERYKDLKEFFEKHKSIDESKQLESILKALKS